MKDISVVERWLNSGKQIGKTFSFEKDGQVCWSSVGVQLWNGRYKVHIDEVLESNMTSEEYDKELTESFTQLSLVEEYILSNSRTQLVHLMPCKGQKIFNPEFN